MNPKFDQTRIQELHKMLQSVLSELGPVDPSLIKDVPTVDQLPVGESSEENDLDKPDAQDGADLGSEQMLNNLFGDKVQQDLPSFQDTNEGNNSTHDSTLKSSTNKSGTENVSSVGVSETLRISDTVPEYANISQEPAGMFPCIGCIFIASVSKND